MATVLRTPEQRVLLNNITWDLYEELLIAHRDRSAPRFTYDRGQLEITSPSAEHEQVKERLTLLVNICGWGVAGNNRRRPISLSRPKPNARTSRLATPCTRLG